MMRFRAMCENVAILLRKTGCNCVLRLYPRMHIPVCNTPVRNLSPAWTASLASTGFVMTRGRTLWHAPSMATLLSLGFHADAEKSPLPCMQTSNISDRIIIRQGFLSALEYMACAYIFTSSRRSSFGRLHPLRRAKRFDRGGRHDRQAANHDKRIFSGGD